MVTVYNYKSDVVRNTNDGDYIMVELRGKSTDTKPTKIGDKIISNGSAFIEIDTQKIYFFDEDSQEWKGE